MHSVYLETIRNTCLKWTLPDGRQLGCLTLASSTDSSYLLVPARPLCRLGHRPLSLCPGPPEWLALSKSRF